MNQSSADEKLLATFLVCAYNQEGIVHEAISGAFSQTYSPLEIIISDDFRLTIRSKSPRAWPLLTKGLTQSF